MFDRYKGVTTCGNEVVPELRFASGAKTSMVEKRLPIGDRCRRSKKRAKDGENIPCFSKKKKTSVPLLFVPNLFFLPCRLATCGEAFVGDLLLVTSQPHDETAYDHMP